MNVEIVKESFTHDDGIIRNLAQLLPDVTSVGQRIGQET